MTFSKEGEYLDDFDDNVLLARYRDTKRNTRYLERHSSIFTDEGSNRQVKKVSSSVKEFSDVNKISFYEEVNCVFVVVLWKSNSPVLHTHRLKVIS